MPRKPKTSTGKKEPQLSDAAKRAQDFLKEIKDDNVSLLHDAKANVVDYISSGSLSFNRMISGSYYKGYASNRLYAIHGPSGCGKSLLAGCAAREAQKKDYQVIYYDTENAITDTFLRRLGVDPSIVIVRTPQTISDFRNMAANDMRLWREKYDDAKLFLICDSIGNLMGTKEYNDIMEGKNAADMGQRAKELRTCARTMTNLCGKYNIPMIVINHSYEQAAANPMAAPIRKMSGGEGFVYSCTGIVNLRKSSIKEKEKNAAGDNKRITKGVILKGKTDKNRVVPEGLECEIMLSFTKGLSQFYGLLVDALEHGFFEKKGTRIHVKHLDKSFFEKHLYKKENIKDVWKPILSDLNKKVEESAGFADLDESEDVNDGFDEEILENEKTE